MSLVSVVVPIFNCENDLEMCIQSILVQSYKKLEIILVDDGSTDASGAICDKLSQQDNRIRVIHKQNAGVSSARNSGLDCCMGKYVLFVDSDDYLYPDAIRILVETAEKNDVELVVFGFCYKNVTNNTRHNNIPGNSFCGDVSEFVEKFSAEMLRKEFFNPPWNKLIHRDLIEKNNVRFNESISICEDMALSMQLLMHASQIAIINEVLYDYCIKESGSLVFKYNKNFIEAVSYYLECADKCMDKYGRPQSAVSVIRTICVSRVYMHFLKLCGSLNANNKLIGQERNKLFESKKVLECIRETNMVKKFFFGVLRIRLYFLNRMWSKIKGY